MSSPQSRFEYRKGLFVRGLFGADRLSGSVNDVVMTISGMIVGPFSTTLGNQTSFAVAPGAGMQIKVTPSFSIRFGADYVMTHHDVIDAALGLPRQSIHQNNFRISVGPVFTFRRSTQTQAIASSRFSSAAMSIPALGVMVTPRESGGAEILAVEPNGIAAFSGIRVGDVINAVDGKPVQTPMALAVALSDRSPGTKVTLGHSIRGQWQSETIIILGAHP